MKSKRQRKIIDLIGEYDIDTQEESRLLPATYVFHYAKSLQEP